MSNILLVSAAVLRLRGSRNMAKSRYLNVWSILLFLGFWDQVHFLHQKGGIQFLADAGMQAVVENQLVVVEGHFETVVFGATGILGGELADAQVVGGNDHYGLQGQELFEETVGAFVLVHAVGATQYFIENNEGVGLFFHMGYDALQALEFGVEIAFVLRQRVADVDARAQVAGVETQ